MPQHHPELGRPNMLTEDVQADILRALEAGNYIKVSVIASGISYHTFRYWKQRWENGDPEASRFDNFYNSVERAKYKSEVNALATVRQGNQGWQGNAWFLERRFSSRWGRKDRSPQPPKKSADEMNDKELAEERERLKGK